MSKVSVVSPRRRKRRVGRVEVTRRRLGSPTIALQLSFEFLRSQNEPCAEPEKAPACAPAENPPSVPQQEEATPESGIVLSRSERNRLLASTDELARQLSKRAKRSLPSVDFDDILAYARLGLVEALERFDPEKGGFPKFAKKRINGAIIGGIRQFGEISPVAYKKLVGTRGLMSTSGAACVDDPPQSERNHAVYSARVQEAVNSGKLPRSCYVEEEGEHIPLSDEESPEQHAARRQLLSKVARCVESLPKEQATLMREHYEQGKRIDHIAAARGVDKSWVSRVHGHGLRAIARKLREDTGEPITSETWRSIYR